MGRGEAFKSTYHGCTQGVLGKDVLPMLPSRERKSVTLIAFIVN